MPKLMSASVYETFLEEWTGKPDGKEFMIVADGVPQVFPMIERADGSGFDIMSPSGTEDFREATLFDVADAFDLADTVPGSVDVFAIDKYAMACLTAIYGPS